MSKPSSSPNSSPNSNPKVFILVSPLPLDTIKTELVSTGKVLTYVGVVNHWRSEEKKWIETKNNLIIGEESLKDALLKKYPKYNNKIWEYDWDRFFREPNEDENYTLHVSGFPTRWDDQEVKDYIADRLDCLIDPSEYTVNLSMIRETGKIKGFGTIVFEDTVTNEYRKYVKLVLHNKVIREEGIDEKDLSALRVMWSRKSKVSRNVKKPEKMTSSTTAGASPNSNANSNVSVNVSNVNKSKVNKKVITIKNVNSNQAKSTLPQVKSTLPQTSL